MLIDNNYKHKTIHKFNAYFTATNAPFVICLKLNIFTKLQLANKYSSNQLERGILIDIFFSGDNLISWDTKEDRLSFSNTSGCLETYSVFYGIGIEENIYQLLLRNDVVNVNEDITYLFSADKEFKRRLLLIWSDRFLGKIIRETFKIEENEIVFINKK